ncbi:MAG: phosphotransferase family protein [Suilimivivens sp.]
MAKSKTKYIPEDDLIIKIFAKNKITDIEKIEPLGNGEFNAAFKVVAASGEYAIKFAPPDTARVLTYEKDMMKSEVYWYRQISENTTIHVPEIYAFDFSHDIVPTSCFIMEMMRGEPLWAVEMSDSERARVQEEKLGMLAQIHGIHHDKFGYIQMGLHNNWYEAIRTMVSALIADCEQMGKSTPDGHRLLSCIDRHKNILERVRCSMVNFDLWDSNVLYDRGDIVWIDPERSFYGDPIGDFITQGAGQKASLGEKKKEIAVYNRSAKIPIEAGEEEEIRYAVMVAYLALIEEVEKYVRYEPDEENYIRNTVDAADMYNLAFTILE